MPRITPQHYRKLVGVFLKAGLSIAREEGDHILMNRPDLDRPVVIPKYQEVGVDIIRSNLRSARINREEYFRLLLDS